MPAKQPPLEGTFQVDPAQPAPTQPPAAVVAQRAPFIGWFAKHVVLPLAPFLVGSLIRYIRMGEPSAEIFAASELGFSLAMFCLIGAVAARRIEDSQYREAAFTLFVIGVALFMSLFSFAVSEATRLETLHHEAVTNAAKALATKSPALSQDTIAQLLHATEQREVENTQQVILFTMGILGVLFLFAGFVMRDRYALGEDS